MEYAHLVNARRLLVLALSVSTAVLAWLELRQQPALPSVIVAPSRAVEGRLLDEGGVPIADASVQLFDHAGLWLEAADQQAACELSLLACARISAGREVLRQLDAGTLIFPEAVARVRTDADGRFVFREVKADQFVAARGAVSAIPLEDSFTFKPETQAIGVNEGEAWLPGAMVLVIDPFTREVRRESSDALGSVAAGRWTWAVCEGGGSTVIDPSESRRSLLRGEVRPLELQLVSEAGAVPEGAFTLSCEHFVLEARSKNGVLHFDEVLARYCQLSGTAGDFAANNAVVRAWQPSQTVMLQQTVRLVVTVKPDVAGRLEVDQYAREGIAAIGSSPSAEGDFAPGTRRELAGLKPSDRARVSFKAEGYERASRVLPLVAGVNEVTFTLTPARIIKGTVASGTLIKAWAEQEWLGWTEAVDGGFSIEVNRTGPIRLGATHPLLGAANVVVNDGRPVVLTLAAQRLVVVRASLPNGKPWSGPVFLSGSELEEWLERRADDAGVARFADATPGLRVVRVGVDERVVPIPDAGVVELTLTVEPGAVLMGTLLLEGAPVAGLNVTTDKRQVISNAAGQFRFEELKPGPHLLVVSDESGRSFEFDAGAPDLDLKVTLPR